MAEPEEERAINGAGSMTVSEVTGLVGLFNESLLAMEGRLVSKMDDSSRRAAERWVKHDLDSERLLKDIEHRFDTIEKALRDHVLIAEKRWAEDHDEELVLQARIKPVTSFATYIARNWRTILLIIVSLLAILGFSSDTLTRVLGG